MRDLEAGKRGDVLSFSVQVLKTFILSTSIFPPVFFCAILVNLCELFLDKLFFFS